MAIATRAVSNGVKSGGFASRLDLLSRDSTTYWIVLGAIATILSVVAAATLQMRREQSTVAERIERETREFREFVSHSGLLVGVSLDRTRENVSAAIKAAASQPLTSPLRMPDATVMNLIALNQNGEVYGDINGTPSQVEDVSRTDLFQRLLAQPNAPYVTGSFESRTLGSTSLAIATRPANPADPIYFTLVNTSKLAASLADIRGRRPEHLFIINRYARPVSSTQSGAAASALLSEVLSSLPPGISSSPLVRPLEHEGVRYIASAMQIPGYDLRVVSISRAAEIAAGWTDYLPLWSIMIIGPSLLGAALSWALLNQMEQAQRSRSALRRTEERFELAVSGARCGIWDWDVPNRKMYWSGAMNGLLGLGPQPRVIPLDDLEKRLHPEDIGALRTIENTILRGAEHYDASFRIRHEDGHFVWIRAKGQAYRTLRAEHPRLSGIALDISDQKHAAERLSVTERVLKAAFENAAEAFALWDQEGRLILCNRRFLDFYGLSEAKLGDPRTRLLSRVVQQDHAADGSPLELIDFGGSTGTVELQRVDDRWLLVSERKATEDARIMVATDITALKQHEDALQQSHQQLQEQTLKLGEIAIKLEREKQRAEEGSRSKTEFLANMSHELRTPLNAIMGFSDAMRNAVLGPLPPRYIGYANDIHASGASLLRQIDEVLNMARIEAGQMELNFAPTDLKSLVIDSAHEIEDKARAAGITLRMQLRDLPAVRADRQAIREVMSNLLSNALKFNATSGYITIETRMLGDQASVWIHDTGVGIAPENLTRVLKPFERIEKAVKASKKGGTGLGLAASNGIIARHDGRLSIESETGIGTSVFFTLPLAA